MSTDSQAKEPGPRRVDLWKLPDVLEVKATHVRYHNPLIRYLGTQRVEYSEAVELLVKTSDGLPERALSPALYVGDIPVADYETAGHRLYRFFAFDIGALREGAPITLDWPQQRREKIHEAPRFRLGGKESR